MLRVAIARAVFVLLVVPLSAVAGVVGPSMEQRRRPNACLVLASRHDLRSAGGSRLATRIGTVTWIAYILGVGVVVDWTVSPPRLLDDSLGGVGELSVVDAKRNLFVCLMAGGTSAPFFLKPSKLRSAGKPG